MVKVAATQLTTILYSDIQKTDMNNANGMATNINDNTFGENNKCGTSTPAGLC